MLDRTVDPKLYVNNNAEYLQICLFDSVEEDVDESTDL